MINSIYLKLKPFLQMTTLTLIATFLMKKKINSFESTYYTHEEFVSFCSNLSENFSITHLNIRSLHKNIDKLKDFLNDIKGKFSVIVLSETWIDDDKADLNSLFHIPNYSFIHEKRKTKHKGGGLEI